MQRIYLKGFLQMVYVINYDNQPLMPCSNVIARLLLKQGKAKVKRKTPFTIKLTYQANNYTQNLTLGIDTGSSKIGSAVIKENGDIVYLAQIENNQPRYLPRETCAV